MVLLIGSFQCCDNLRIAVCIQLQELLVFSHDAEAALLTLQGTSPRVRVRVSRHFFRAIHID